jgi:glucose-6-phosphate 1-dehydrogenase
MDLPLSIVIFGASGDLSHRKLIPALYHLYLKKRLPQKFSIFGIGGREWSDDDLRSTAYTSLKELYPALGNEEAWKRFASAISYHSGNFNDSQTFQHLADGLTKLEKGAADRIYYLATPPEFFLEIIMNLANQDMLEESEGCRRVVIEKPFGSDGKSARDLNEKIHQVMSESQVYRIDHYLGKETVQNILVARFANTIFEPVWNRNYIENIQITVAEAVGVEQRGKYYDKAGTVRDMFQNHLLQLLTLVAMEPTSSYKPDALRDEKVKVISAIRPIRAKDVNMHAVRGQYKGYRKEPNVLPESHTETYAAIRFFIDNWRWQGVPFYLRSGKKLKEKSSEINIVFKSPPHMIFANKKSLEAPSNMLSMCLQPDEGILLRFEVKVPDTIAETKSVDMDYHYRDEFGPNAIPEAYERLLLDVINGDASLFTRADQTEISWDLFDPILESWKDPEVSPIQQYDPGSWGPAVADEFIASTGHNWQQICGEHCRDGK